MQRSLHTRISEIDRIAHFKTYLTAVLTVRNVTSPFAAQIMNVKFATLLKVNIHVCLDIFVC